MNDPLERAGNFAFVVGCIFLLTWAMRWIDIGMNPKPFLVDFCFIAVFLALFDLLILLLAKLRKIL